MASSNFPNRPFRLEESVWLLSQNVANNTSVVRAQLWIKKNSTSPTYSFNTSSFTFFINGAQVAGGEFTYDFRNSNELLLAQVDVTIPHNADGTKSYAIDGYANAALLGYTEVHSANGLPTIPRTSTFGLSPSIHDNRPDQVTTIVINRASSSFTHNIKVAFGNWSQWIAYGVGASFQWTPPWDLLKQIPNADTGVGTIWVDTFSGNTYIGTSSLPWRLNAPASVVPSVTQITAAELNPDVASIVGKYVQNLSRVKFTVTGAGVYDSTITSATAKMLGSTVPSGGDIAVTSSGTLPVTATVTDSRGRQKVDTSASIAALAYTPPAATAFQARRSTASGTVMDDGAYLRVDLTAAIASLINGTQRNALTIRAFTRPRGTGAWTARNVITPAGLTYSTSFVISGGGIFTTTASWDVRVQIHDKFNVYIAETTVSTISVTMDMNGKNVGIGKIWEAGTLDVAGDTRTSGDYFHRGGYPVEPVGIITPFGGATAPSGWLICDGSAVSRTTYADLFAVVGTAYGTGNGSSTFNLPDLRGRVPVGRDSTQTEFDVLGEKGGAKTHTLSANEMPVHSHKNHEWNVIVSQGANTGRWGAPAGNMLRPMNEDSDQNRFTGNAGGGAAHNNLQPYLVVNHIIKAL